MKPKTSKKLRHTFDMGRGMHQSKQHRNQKSKVRGTKGAFGGKRGK